MTVKPLSKRARGVFLAFVVIGFLTMYGLATYDVWTNDWMSEPMRVFFTILASCFSLLLIIDWVKSVRRRRDESS